MALPSSSRAPHNASNARHQGCPGSKQHPNYPCQRRRRNYGDALTPSDYSLSGSSNHSVSSGSERSLSGISTHSLSSNSTHSLSSSHSTASLNSSNHSNVGGNSGFVHSYKKPQMPAHSLYIAADCEMVGTLTGQSVLARVVLVNWKGKVIYDALVQPQEPVTDYRTHVSGITAEKLQQEGQPHAEVRAKVQCILEGKILVGHGLQNDLKCLGIEHPWHMQRDTAYYEPFMQKCLEKTPTASRYASKNGMLPRKLKDLAAEKLSRQIQVPGKAHCPTEDAVTALDLYKSHRPRWEKCLQSEINQAARRQKELHQQQDRERLYLQRLQLLHQQQQQSYFYASTLPQHPTIYYPASTNYHPLQGHCGDAQIYA